MGKGIGSLIAHTDLKLDLNHPGQGLGGYGMLRSKDNIELWMQGICPLFC